MPTRHSIWEACPKPEMLASRSGCFNRGNTAYISWTRFSISWKPTEEYFLPHRRSSFMLTADSIREARVCKSAARNWLLLCESAGCDIIKLQECIEKLVVPSATEMSLKLLFLFGFEEILTTSDCAFVCTKSCFSFFHVLFFFFLFFS